MSADTGPQTRVVAGRYALGEVLGRGGMGTVWLATDRVLERQVAVKEVTFPLHVTEEERAVLRERTMREARAAGRLEHPHVTTVYDVVEEGGMPWLVMKHVAARSLQQVIEAEGPLPPAEVARIGLHVLEALVAAHALGIVHRDVKPANVLVGPDGSGCLTDFGIATTTGDRGLTSGGALIGSPSYMAPERAHGDEPHPAADLWSLGATLYAAVEGRPPFDGGDSMATLMSVVSEPPAPMLRAGPLEPVLRGLLTKDPGQRSTAAVARSQLATVAAGNAPAAPPPPSAPGPIAGDRVERIDAADLLALASASRALLGSVARDARDHARHLRGSRRERREPRPAVQKAPPAPPTRRKPRFRFKRRWVVVPVVTTVLVLLLLVIGVVLALGALLA
ncbi:serine/threonine protein kinase [Blastococcus sp. TF02-09]|uniref:serine/threonine-protein kinase n=1 Tax=Blastococcus sp. TF02-09 TaxID=2250576 RepID=UPI000DEAEB6E|nr:serine/threonine-protein kinase [Blastococcus sp. TF02-9]RBY79384.1 serine/threonine protein kinase [Blastococcus sp. TF02-9]